MKVESGLPRWKVRNQVNIGMTDIILNRIVSQVLVTVYYKMIVNKLQSSVKTQLPVQMVRIPAGEILLRDDRIKRTWEVKISPFEMGCFPVTQDLYSEITGEYPATFQGNRLPIESVSWMEAVRFCNLLNDHLGLEQYYAFNSLTGKVAYHAKTNGYRLPSEAEWEYACKAGSTTSRYGVIRDIAWYRGNADGQTHEVGTKTPNAWGLYDMLGNVWEWCSDIYDETVYGSYRIFRGGGWADDERGCLATNRRRSHPVSFKIDDLGFRLARNSPELV